MQRSSKVSKRSLQRQTSIWIIYIAESDRFREHQIDSSADIEEMFLQIAVQSNDNRWLQFLWQEDPEQKVEGNLRVQTARFWGQKLAHLCKLRFAQSGES